MQEASEPWYMYKKITTARDVALLLSDYMKWKEQDPVWFTLPELLEFVDLDKPERVRILRFVRDRLHNRHGLDNLVYVYGVNECKPDKKRKYRFYGKVHEYLIGTSRETRIRDMSCVPEEFQKESKEQQVL